MEEARVQRDFRAILNSVNYKSTRFQIIFQKDKHGFNLPLTRGGGALFRILQIPNLYLAADVWLVWLMGRSP